MIHQSKKKKSYILTRLGSMIVCLAPHNAVAAIGTAHAASFLSLPRCSSWLYASESCCIAPFGTVQNVPRLEWSTGVQPPRWYQDVSVICFAYSERYISILLWQFLGLWWCGRATWNSWAEPALKANLSRYVCIPTGSCSAIRSTWSFTISDSQCSSALST